MCQHDVSPVAEQTMQTVCLSYGSGQTLELEVEESRLRGVFQGPAPATDVGRLAAAALAKPLDFPPLEQAVIPDDRVTLALDAHVPGGAALLNAVWTRLAARGVAPERVTVLQADDDLQANDDITGNATPADRVVPQGLTSVRHTPQPQDSGHAHYLAATAASERIYLAQPLLEADVVVSIGAIGFDPLLGYRGTHSAFYPAMSTAEAVQKAQGQSHSELGPDDPRPLRQLVDEVGWLLGSPFTVQALPATAGGVAAVLAGAPERVLREGRDWLAQHWTLQLAQRVETVVVAVDDVPGIGWRQVAAALSVARRCVERDGRIVVVSTLADAPGPGIELLRRSESPTDALRPLRQMSPPDLLAATQIAEAADWARVYLTSGLDSDLVEDLFCVPVERPEEVARLLSGSDEPCLFISSAQHVEPRVGE